MSKLKKSELVKGLKLLATSDLLVADEKYFKGNSQMLPFPTGSILEIIGFHQKDSPTIMFTMNQGSEIFYDNFKCIIGFTVLNPEVLPSMSQKELNEKEEKKDLRKLNQEIKGQDNPNLFITFLQKYPNFLNDKNNQKRLFLKCIQTKGMNCINYGITQGWFKDIDYNQNLNVYGYRTIDSNLYFALEEGNIEAAKFFMDNGETLDQKMHSKTIRYFLTWEHAQIEKHVVESVLQYEEKLKLEASIKESLKVSLSVKL